MSITSYMIGDHQKNGSYKFKNFEEYIDKDISIFRDMLSLENLPLPPKHNKKLPAIETKKIKEKNYLKYYAITLTTPHTNTEYLDEYLFKILNSQSFQIKRYSIGRELTQAGCPHYHLSVESEKNIYKSDIIKLIGKQAQHSTQCKLLKGPLDKKRWIQYINKTKSQKEIDYFNNLKQATYEENIEL